MTWAESRDSWSAGLRYTRIDGALVKFQMGWGGKMDWIAFEPNPSESYLARTNGRLTWPRRWKTAEAAMRAVDREYPLTQQIKEP